MNAIEFSEHLANMRLDKYRFRTVDILSEGFRPLSGAVADFCTIEHNGKHHFFYIERRLKEGTPFYPGNEIYFGHASTQDFTHWEVHDPVVLIRPGTWEGAHVWAPYILGWNETYVMAYTGVNEHLSQNIGLAFSDDLFLWERSDDNPLSPCKGKSWSFWRMDGIASCRDPHLVEFEGRVYMSYTANTAQGATCIALASTSDLKSWTDHGPILIGPCAGYEPSLQGGHAQGSMESSNLIRKNDLWHLLFQWKCRDKSITNWIVESNSIDDFDLANAREFWPDAYTTEVVKENGPLSLLASAGTFKLGQVDWSEEQPCAKFLTQRSQVDFWLST